MYIYIVVCIYRHIIIYIYVGIYIYNYNVYVCMSMINFYCEHSIPPRASPVATGAVISKDQALHEKVKLARSL